MESFLKTYRRLALLGEIASNKRVSQRSLAARLGVSLGLVNGLLGEMASEGAVEIRLSTGTEPASYAVTPLGRRIMRKLARKFSRDADALMKKTRRALNSAARDRRAGRG